LEKFLYPKSKHLIAISQTVENSLVEVKQKTPCSVIHHAADSISKIEINERANKIKRVLFVGALERKGIEFSLQTLSLLKNKNWQFDVVGDGDIDNWKRFSKKLNISEKVHFHGVRPSAAFFAKADIFLFPSTYEPFGLVVSEAVSHGCAVLASSECGAMELWSTRESWLKLSVKDSMQMWASSLDKLLDDQNLTLAVATQAGKSFLTYSWDDASEKYEEVISNYLGNE
jgi:glycosyltransferase involved in cell wall biosynthesis